MSTNKGNKNSLNLDKSHKLAIQTAKTIGKSDNTYHNFKLVKLNPSILLVGINSDHAKMVIKKCLILKGQSPPKCPRRGD